MKSKTVLTKTQERLLSRVDLAPAREAFVRAAAYSRLWDKSVSSGIAKYGERPGSHISGTYSDHFPVILQNRLRTLAHSVTRESSEAWNRRPTRVRTSTMRALHDAVRCRDGSGFYG